MHWPSWSRLNDNNFMSQFPSGGMNDSWLRSDDLIRDFDALYPRLGKSSIKPKLVQSVSIPVPRKYERKLQLGNTYKPSGIEINLSEDRKMEVRAKKEFSELKNGCKCFVVEVFTQTVDIPENVDVKNIKTVFNRRGELVITAPILFTAQNKENAIEIKINKTK